jgi:hypothetical protein
MAKEGLGYTVCCVWDPLRGQLGLDGALSLYAS